MRNFWADAVEMAELLEGPHRDCTGCGKRKPIEEFAVTRPTRTGKPYRVRRCRACLAAYQREYRERNGPRKRRPRQEGPKKCSLCGETKPAAAFGTAPESATGLRCYCKPCSAEYSRKKREQYKRDYDGPDVERKLCPGCGETKRAREFNRNRSSRSGLHCYCRPCHRKMALASYHKNKRLTGRNGDDHPWRKTEKPEDRA